MGVVTVNIYGKYNFSLILKLCLGGGQTDGRDPVWEDHSKIFLAPDYFKC